MSAEYAGPHGQDHSCNFLSYGLVGTTGFETTTEDEQTANRSTIKKAQFVIDVLRKAKELVSIEPVDQGSSDLKEFDSAVNLLTAKYKIPVPEAEVTKVRKSIAGQEVMSGLTASLSLAPFVELSGPFDVTEHEGYLRLVLKYLNAEGLC